MRKYLGRVRRYIERLSILNRVRREIRGDTPADQAILDRSLRHDLLNAHRDLDAWRDPVADADCTVRSALGRFHVRANSDDLLTTLPSREPHIAETIRSTLRPGDVFVDAGANIGVYTVLASSLGAKVIAIEMMPETAAILRRHVELNGCKNVTIIERALSDEPETTLTASVDPGHYGAASVALLDKEETWTVLTTTFADVLADVETVRLMKMDIEGAEMPALTTLPTDKVEAVIFEEWGAEFAGVSDWFRDHGYSVRKLSRTDGLAIKN